MNLAKVVTGTLAGLALFSTGSSLLYSAQAAAVLPHAYYVAEFEVTDPEGIQPYSTHVESTFKSYGGHFIVRGGKTISLREKPRNVGAWLSNSIALRKHKPGTTLLSTRS